MIRLKLKVLGFRLSGFTKGLRLSPKRLLKVRAKF
jgi:hypothetical protein